MLSFITIMLALLLSVVFAGPIKLPFDIRTGDETDLICYDRCYGIDRTRALEAADWFCKTYAATHLYYTASDGHLAISDNFTYTPEAIFMPGNYEEGVIWMSMGYLFDGSIKDDACTGLYEGYDITYDYCYSGLKATVDQCDTAGVTGKQGGRFRDECFQWILNPAPVELCTRF